MHIIVQDQQPDIGQVLEDNVLALLDTVGVKNTEDIEDDKMSFLEAVYALCIAGTQPKAPTWPVHRAVFKLLDANQSLSVNMTSYSLLIEIAQEYPHILIRENKNSKSKEEIVLNTKIWSPFRENLCAEHKVKSGISTRQAIRGGQQYCQDFISLLEELQAEFGEKPWAKSIEMSTIEMTRCSNYKVDCLLLKVMYLVKIMQHDFNCWLEAYKVTKEETIMSECYLIHLFRSSNVKTFLELLFDLIASSNSSWKCEDQFLSFRELSLSLQALIEMRLQSELENRRLAPSSPRKPRTDASRNSNFIEALMMTFQFNKELLKAVLQVMEDSDCKLKIICTVFVRDIPKPLAAERIHDPENMTTQELLDCLKDINSARNVYKVSDSDVLQVFLASAFKVGIRERKLDTMDNVTLELCKSLKIAFQNLQSISNEFNDLHPAAKKALITAEIIINLMSV